MNTESNIGIIAKAIYALAYELTTWMKFESPKSKKFRFDVDIKYEGDTRELRIERDEQDTFTFSLFNDSIEVSLRRGRHASDTNVVRQPRFTLMMYRPTDDTAVPRLAIPNKPEEVFPDNVFPFLHVYDVLETCAKEAHRFQV